MPIKKGLCHLFGLTVISCFFASRAIIGAGMAVVTEQLNGQPQITLTVASMTVAVPLASYLLSLWSIHTYYPRQSEHKIQFQIPLCIPII
ncbi:MAG: hypothetical protein HRU20_16890 [Pseudomonadales bacterium]|nr:hypothetical protein [Pseudomonadales bacterium]